MTQEATTTTNSWALPLLGIAILCAVVVALVVKAVRTYKNFSIFWTLPGPKYSPLFGNIHQLPADSEGKIAFGDRIMQEIDPKMMSFWMSPVTPGIFVYHPDTVKVVLQSFAAPKSRGPGQAYEYGIPWVGEGVLLANGDGWSRGRKMLTPSFHPDNLKTYVDIFNRCADTLLEKFDKFAESGESFDICPLVTMCTLEIIMKCFLSRDSDIQSHQGEGHHPYAEAVLSLSEIWAHRHWRPWLWPDFIFRNTSVGKTFFKHCDYVHKIDDEIIENKRQMMETDSNAPGKTKEFIDILLAARYEDGQPMSNLEIRNQVDTFVFAGHDTTATTLTFHMYNLATHLEHQEKLKEEVDGVMEGRDSVDVLWDDVSSFKQMTLSSKESMRIYSPVPFISRTLTEDMMLEGNTIPAGTPISVAFSFLHRNPAVWDCPEEYRPERFLEPGIDKFACLPFSAGHRNCLGQAFGVTEERILLARILRRYNIGVAPDHEPPIRKLSVILKAEKGIWITLKRREDV